MEMSLPLARVVGRYPNAFDARTLLEAYITLRGQPKAAVVRIKGDPDAPTEQEEPSDLAAAILNTLAYRNGENDG